MRRYLAHEPPHELVQSLRWVHLRRAVGKVHRRFGRPVKFIHLELIRPLQIGAASIVIVCGDLKTSHKLWSVKPVSAMSERTESNTGRDF